MQAAGGRNPELGYAEASCDQTKWLARLIPPAGGLPLEPTVFLDTFETNPYISYPMRPT